MATKYHPGPMADRLENTTEPALMNGSLTAGARGTTEWPRAGDDTGMLAATAWVAQDYERYTFPYSQWTAEIRFPIRQTPNYSTRGGGYPTAHGGLIDADPVRQKEWDQCDPALGDAGPGRPRYWWVNFARAEHPKKFTFADGSFEICPKNCTARLEHAVNVTSGYPTPKGGACLGAPPCSWPTILGSYWEWVWGPVGDAHPGVGYMHRPSSFPLVQFANSSGAALCRSIEFPGRHVAESLHLAQAAYAHHHGVCSTGSHTTEAACLQAKATWTGSFAAEVSTLLNASLCSLDLTTSDTCDLDALQFAVAHPGVFKLDLAVTKNIGAITRACPARPCYMATVEVTVPTDAGASDEDAVPYVYTASINNNRDTTVQHHTATLVAPCL
jgi:hypothetical protein